MGYVGLIIAIFGMSVVQLLIKYRFNVEHGPTPTDRTLIPYISRLIFDPWLWLSAAILVFSALLWYFAVSRLPLSTAIAFAALVYPTVTAGSLIFLGEQVNFYHFVGCSLVVSGIWLIAANSA